MKLKLNELMLVYLLMNIDGSVSNEEMERFDEVLKEYDSLDKKDFIIETVNEILANEFPETTRVKSIFEEFNKYLSSQTFANKVKASPSFVGGAAIPILSVGLAALTVGSSFESRFHSKLLLWTLINMAMADGVCVESERELIISYSNKVDLPSLLVEELFDIAKAMYSLEVHKEWLKNENKKPYGEIEPLMKELEKNSEVLKQNLQNLISNN